MTRHRRLLLPLLAGVGLLSGCAWFRDPPEQGITTGATVVYSGQGFRVFSLCDKGNLVYSSEKNPQVFVIPGGCNPGAPGGPAPAAVAAATDRTVADRTPLFALPQPFVIQIDGASRAEAPVAEPRSPLVIQVVPMPPAAPGPLEAPAPTCPPPTLSKKAAPKAAPKPCP